MEANNLQELKDAAIELMKFTCNSCERRFCEEDVEEEDGTSVPSPCSAIIRMRNALSANPTRNIDVGTPEEQAQRYHATGGLYHTLTLRNALTWARMPYEEGGAK